MNRNYNYHNGFTLAEVLITLVIIGVIAAMTIPTLMNNVQNQERVSQLKQAYSELAQATTSIMGDNGGNIAGLCSDTDHDCLMGLYSAKMNTTKICTTSDTIAGVCWHANDGSCRELNNVTTAWATTLPAFITARGSLIRFTENSGTCSSDLTMSGSSLNSNVGCGSVAVDVNGFAKPNIVGRDIFRFAILRDRVVPFGTPNDSFSCLPAGAGCAAKVLLEGKMDY